jgi:hypothetical protein
MNRLLRLAAASAVSLAAAGALAACSSGVSVPQASSGTQQQSVAHQAVSAQGASPRYEVLRYKGPAQLPPAGGVPLWNGSFVYASQTYNYTMLGANPASSNVTTTIPVDIIPVKIITIEKTKYDPDKVKTSNGQTITKNVYNSPIFQSGIDYVQGGTDLGNTQYIDAFQRGNFWSSVSTNTGYHTLLSPTILKEVTLKSGVNGNPFGNLETAEVNINTFDSFATREINALQIPPGTIPIFITYNTYLTDSGCCIGGYHSYTGTHVYAQASYISETGDFSQDISALSHEIGEFYDDPQTNNSVDCGILEVGDPLEGGQPGHPYGTWPYSLNNFTYHMQDLVFLPYFGAPPSTSVNSWSTFQGYSIGVCSNGG